METLGVFLKQQREKSGISVEEIGAKTKVRVALLKEMEEDHLENLPGGVFLRGFVKAYTDAVGCDGQKGLELLDAQVAPEQPAQVLATSEYVGEERHNPGRFRLAHLLVLVVSLLAMMAVFFLSSGANRSDQAVTSIQVTDVDSGTTRSFTPPQ